MAKDDLLDELDEFNKLVDSCDPKVPIYALVIGGDIENAYNNKEIDENEFKKIHRKAHIASMTFKHNCLCKKA